MRRGVAALLLRQIGCDQPIECNARTHVCFRIVEQIARAIRKDKRFWMPGFGTFSVRRRRPRAGFNPRTKAAMTIPAARTVGFRPAPKLKKGL